MWEVLVLTYLPILYLLAYTFKALANKRIARTHIGFILIFAVVMIAAVGLYPEDLTIDKPRYANMYARSMIEGDAYEFRDPGWAVYNSLCGMIFGAHIDLFFLLTAFIYVGGVYVMSRITFPKEYIGYFIVMSAGCLGFSNYGTNVIRAGIAISLLLLAYSLKIKTIFKLLIAIVAISFQISMVIPFVAFIGSKFIKETRLAVLIWLLCLFLSAATFDIGVIFENFGFVDERVDKYVSTIDDVSGRYNKGFRLDFLLYSIAPILISFYYLFIKRIKDARYSHIVRTYLLANAVWLLAIRISYSDRLAYLSWFMIPYLTLYPVIIHNQKFRLPQQILLMVMYVFMGVNLALSFNCSS